MASEGLNKVLLIGNLGMDPELKFTQSGRALLRIRLATTERYGRQDGERQERTEWHTVVVWGNRAEALDKFLRKGRTIYVEGRLQTRSWEGQDGGKRYSTEIVANEILLLGSGRGEGDQSGAGGSQRGAGTHREERYSGGGYGGSTGSSASSGGDQQDFPDDFGDDDGIPF